MNQPSKGQNTGKPRILVSPLDWGLGHATRCIPLIEELIKNNCEVILATDGAQESLLREEFPSLEFVKLKGYNAKYARSARSMLWQMLIQIPKFNRVIASENKWLQKIISDHKIDAVISDNRYGLYSKLVPTVFITHQLLIKSPLGKLTELLLQKRNYRYIKKFSECWIPDSAADPLAGELSHPLKKPKTLIKYIGHLSRFKKKDIPEINDHLLVSLSGPEPQRSILENIIIDQIAHYKGTATIVRGLPGSASVIPSTNMIKFYNHLPAKELNEEIQKAAFIICRSGYSSVMDIAALKKRSILIPTPGQTEQEYLAKYLFGKKFAMISVQNKFSLDKLITLAKGFDYTFPEHKHNLVKETLQPFLSSLKR